MSKQDSNLSTLYIAEESGVIGVLGGTPDWFRYEPNSFGDFGGSTTKVARSTINPTRKRLKGNLTDVEATGSFEHDFVLFGLLRLLRGFFFTQAEQTGTTSYLSPTSALNRTASSVTTSTIVWSGNLVTDLDDALVVTKGFTNAANNTMDQITVATDTATFVNATLVTEASPPSDATMRKCGWEFAAGDLEATAIGTTGLQLDTTLQDLTAIELTVGETIFIGGDAAGTQFDDGSVINQGFGRVVSVSTNSMLLTDLTFTPVTDAGATDTIQIFYGQIKVYDEPLAANIARTTYQLERKIGADGGYEYIKGAVPNEFSISCPSADKMVTSFGFMGLDEETRTDADGAKTGNRYEPVSEEFVNTTSDVHTMRIIKTSDGTDLIGYVESMELSINNGINPNKAVGVLGAFEMATGDFEVSGSCNAYFDTVDAKASIRANDDVSVQLIVAKDNEGFAMTLPLITLDGGQVQIESDSPVMLPLDIEAAVGSEDITMFCSWFPYLPDAAMPA